MNKTSYQIHLRVIIISYYFRILIQGFIMHTYLQNRFGFITLVVSLFLIVSAITRTILLVQSL